MSLCHSFTPSTQICLSKNQPYPPHPFPPTSPLYSSSFSHHYVNVITVSVIWLACPKLKHAVIMSLSRWWWSHVSPEYSYCSENSLPDHCVRLPKTTHHIRSDGRILGCSPARASTGPCHFLGAYRPYDSHYCPLLTYTPTWLCFIWGSANMTLQTRSFLIPLHISMCSLCSIR